MISLPLPPMFKHIALSCSDGTSRYAIAGVLVESVNDKVSICATDGHHLSLFEYQYQHSPDFSVILTAASIKNLKPKTKDDLRLESSGDGNWGVTYGDVEQPIRTIQDSIFPPYRDCIPDYCDADAADATKMIGLNPRIMEKICKIANAAIKADTTGGVTGFRYQHRAANKPAMFTLTATCRVVDNVKYTAVLMPVNLRD